MAAPSESSIAAGEIRFDGTLRTINVTQRVVILNVTAFTLPNGRQRTLTSPKAKTVVLTEPSSIYANNQPDRSLSLQDLATGMTVSVTGKDLGSGQPLPARVMIVELPATTEPPPSETSNQSEKPTPVKQPQLELQLGHSGRITSIAFSPDNKLIATGARDGVVKLWGKHSGQLLHTLVEKPGTAATRNAITAINFSPNGKTLATGGWEPTPLIRLWDVETGRLQRSLQGDSGRIGALAFSPNGIWLVSAGYDETIKVWDTNTWEAVRVENPHDGLITSLAFSPDGKLMASASMFSPIRLWDARRG